MTRRECLEKNLLRPGLRQYTLTTIAFTVIFTIIVLGIIRPWNLLAIEFFVFIQAGSLSIVVLFKLLRFFGMICCCEVTTHFSDSFTLCALCIFVNATICGFVHPELSFKTKQIKVGFVEGNPIEVDLNFRGRSIDGEKADSPMSMVLVLSSVGGVMYTFCVMVQLCFCKC